MWVFRNVFVVATKAKTGYGSRKDRAGSLDGGLIGSNTPYHSLTIQKAIFAYVCHYGCRVLGFGAYILRIEAFLASLKASIQFHFITEVVYFGMAFPILKAMKANIHLFSCYILRSIYA